MKRKIFFVTLLIAVLGIVGFVFLNSNEKRELKQNSSLSGKRNGNATVEGTKSEIENNSVNNDNNVKGNEKVKVKELSDGTLYYINEENIKPDIVIGDNYFDTQLADINLNFAEYEGKTIEIEGMFLLSNNFTFVGRYSTASLCPYCSEGYSYFEYQMNEKGAPEFTEDTWLKIVGTLSKGYDEEFDEEYYYIDVATLEVMNEWGQDTVNN